MYFFHLESVLKLPLFRKPRRSHYVRSSIAVREYLLPPLSWEECNVDGWKVPEGAPRDTRHTWTSRNRRNYSRRKSRQGTKREEVRQLRCETVGNDGSRVESSTAEWRRDWLVRGSFHISPLGAHPHARGLRSAELRPYLRAEHKLNLA